MRTSPWEVFNSYLVLGVAAKASAQEIKSAWRQAAKRDHPDLGGSHDGMVNINIAYEVLSNPITRVAHDIHWKIAPESASPSSTGHAASGAGERAAPRSAAASPRREAKRAPAARSSISEPLAAIRERVSQRVAQEADAIRRSHGDRAERLVQDFAKRVGQARRRFFYGAVGAVAFAVIGMQVPVFFLGTLFAAISAVGSARGPVLGGKARSPLNPFMGWVAGAAQKAATEECDGLIAALSKYDAELASVADLVLRALSFDESESQVARRIATAFFLLGYMPLEYGALDRTLRFTDGDEEVLVRFRHRSGAAVNVTYVEKLVSAMRRHSIPRGYLFCSPGLSGNAASYAEANNVHWYTIESMDQWLDEVLHADYAGPSGDILTHLDTLGGFLGRISYSLPGVSSVPVRRRRRW